MLVYALTLCKVLKICFLFIYLLKFLDSFIILKLPKAFAASLLDYIGSQAQYLHTLMAITQTGKVESNQHGERLRRVEMALEALRNVIKHNPGK